MIERIRLARKLEMKSDKFRYVLRTCTEPLMNCYFP